MNIIAFKVSVTAALARIGVFYEIIHHIISYVSSITVVVVGMVWVISLEESGEGLGGQLSPESAPNQPFLPSIRQHC